MAPKLLLSPIQRADNTQLAIQSDDLKNTQPELSATNAAVNTPSTELHDALRDLITKINKNITDKPLSLHDKIKKINETIIEILHPKEVALQSRKSSLRPWNRDQHKKVQRVVCSQLHSKDNLSSRRCQSKWIC